MRKFISLIIALATILTLAIPTYAGEGYITKTFTYGSFAPVVRFDNACLGGRSLQIARTNSAEEGLSWKTTNANSEDQLFVILPTDTAGYYAITDAKTNSFALTYKPSERKFIMQACNSETGFKPNKYQKFRFVYRTSYTTAKRTGKQCWHLVNLGSKLVFCTGGWSAVKMWRINIPE